MTLGKNVILVLIDEPARVLAAGAKTSPTCG
jgi:hypothetical protein